MIMPRAILRTINVSDKGCAENQTRILCSVTFLKMCLYEITCENITVPEESQITMLILAR